jgi:hypothetical protein
MTGIKTRTAEALFPLLSAFHEVNGLPLRAVRQGLAEDSLVSIVLDFESKALIIRADGEDDTIEFWVVDSSGPERSQGDDASQSLPWKDFVEQEFGWGWVTVNQQGYLDGLILSFGGIMPQLVVTVVASSLKLSRVTTAVR